MSNPYDPNDPMFYLVAAHRLVSLTQTYSVAPRIISQEVPEIPGLAECKKAWDEGKLQMAGIETTRDVAEHRAAMRFHACMDKFFDELEVNKANTPLH